jgi:ATP-dependent Clp protease ATP-binding subunit ClpA
MALPLTTRAKRLVRLASDIAHRTATSGVGDLAMLIAIMEEDRGLAAIILRDFRMELKPLYDALPSPAAAPSAPSTDEHAASAALHPEILSLIESSSPIAMELEVPEIGSEHFLLAITRRPDSSAARMLAAAGITETSIHAAADRMF